MASVWAGVISIICCVVKPKRRLGRVCVCVRAHETAGDVFLWQTRCSALPLWLQINYSRPVSHAATAPNTISRTVSLIDMHTVAHMAWREFAETFATPIKNVPCRSVTMKSHFMCLSPLLLLFLIFILLLLPPLVSLFPPPEDIFILHGKDKKNPLIYGLFTTSRYVPMQSAKRSSSQALM